MYNIYNYVCLYIKLKKKKVVDHRLKININKGFITLRSTVLYIFMEMF